MKVDSFDPTIPHAKIEDLRKCLEFQKDDELTSPFEGFRERFGLTHSQFLNLRSSWISYLDLSLGAEHDTFQSLQGHLKTFSHFTASIEGLKIHFIRESPTASDKVGRKVIPLLLLHGWPGSFLEFLNAVKPLAHPSRNAPAWVPAFEVIVPSQPGYLFSGKFEGEKGDGKGRFSGPEGDLTVPDVARIHHNLMNSLGFRNYAVQGGDWASAVVRSMCLQFPSSIKAVHLNFCPAQPPLLSLPFPISIFMRPVLWFMGLMGLSFLIKFIQEIPRSIPRSWVVERPRNPISWIIRWLLQIFIGFPKPLTEGEKKGFERGTKFAEEGSAYAAFHGTRPSTLGLVISSSPLALLAWISEKFYAWTDEDPHSSEILASLTLWHCTSTFPSSLYPYRNRSPQGPTNYHSQPSNYIQIPTGFTYNPFEIIPTPRAWIKGTCNLKWWRERGSGGHFFAMENPVGFVEDLRECFREIWKD